jgi:hypothetical protein
MTKQLNPKEIFFLKKSIWFMIILFFASNIITVVINTMLNQFLISPEFQETVRVVQSDPIIMVTSNILPFPFIILILYIYLKPIFLEMEIAELSNRSLVKLVNIPIYLSSLAAMGWIVGTISFQSQIMLRGFTDNWDLLIQSTLLTLSMAVVSFVLSFYLLDYFQRTLVIPRIFIGSEYNEILEGVRPNLKQRFLIYIITTSALPGFITFRLLQIFNNEGENVYNQNLTYELIIMYF